MKMLIILLVVLAGCGSPMNVTTRSDPHTATSGTLGSANFNNQLPEGRGDTTNLPVPILPKDTLP